MTAAAAANAPRAVRPPSKALMLMELRALPELGGFLASLPLLKVTAPRGDGHPVLVLPGLITSDNSTIPLRRFLNSHGFACHGWNLGRNYGPRPGIEKGLIELLTRLNDETGRKVSLVGWSLGGIYARQMAKLMPERVRSVITLGSPFNGDPRATNAWRLYEYASGHKVDDRERHMGGPIHVTPPVPTTAIYSRSDGICAWQTCMETDGPEVENIEVEASHCGLGHHPAVVYAVSDRLAQKEGTWTPFDRKGMRGYVFPDPKR